MTYPLKCRCGTVRGTVAEPKLANHAICYCRDCQAFAHFLGRPAEILDERGGSTIFQTLPKYVTITQGSEALACMRLTEKGLMRWYAGCCNTPIGNTAATAKLSFVGLVHSCLEGSKTSLEESFGPVRAVVNTHSATGDPKPKSRGMAATVAWLIPVMIKARIDGGYKKTPFFNIDSGAPVAQPKVLSAEEWSRIKGAVDAELNR
jgi:hypothetical protein